MAGFSEESLDRIRQELNAVPAGNSDFRFHISADCLEAHYFWSEGIEIRWHGREERYICTQHLERSTRTFEIPSEVEAVEKFISVAGSAKRAW